MANRHLARTIALQALFEWDFNNGQRDIKELIRQNKKEFAPDFDDQDFALNLAQAVIKNKEKIDALIVKFAPEWPLDQIITTDRNVLRIGAYELKISQEIPPKVAINEAIELAKAFGGDSSGKFVNGVLGSIYKEMAKKGEKQSLESQGIKEISSGGLIYRQAEDGYYFVLILDAYNKWTFPKGHVEQGEELEKTALRELTEETGLKNLEVIDYLGETQVKVHKPEEKPFRKLIKYFLIKTTNTEIQKPITEEVKDVKWFSKKEALEALGYENAKDIFKEALKKLEIE
ncbi:MAG: transcription antitermination factor NusB [Candidatus Komeilibacteria bacterium CG11_big_fil_rev_8_21_14_0_20_36_20]|uniref:Transcription antitermination protein NusB n=1 Tax=Candidatus Komeilibacteria bacterium CG11_big_fil_rev_8_21_14_0_20_36_20 TaxID=1974477 RepID=A0A2H0NCC9_9BACT|nr:MAG: transcription antitermination factor NusB [Candidatus Komeilibacteria bacterium CG11_big_fil_rev_8_21_14_0_20_36_20]PIR81891.1 MAG: transcription antitermination factor NusB [Candidatus Komeilibacteria bacterium CG10_big_fil_rev_8_21_14_0_10_36_65]